jgi:L-type amino acid transporter 9
MVVVLSSYELINLAYYILLPWDTMSSSDAVAVAAIKSAFGHWAGILVSVLVALSCAGSITSNVFTIGRLTVVAAQHRYIPALFGKRGLPSFGTKTSDSAPLLHASSAGDVSDLSSPSRFDAPMYVFPIPEHWDSPPNTFC